MPVGLPNFAEVRLLLDNLVECRESSGLGHLTARGMFDNIISNMAIRNAHWVIL